MRDSRTSERPSLWPAVTLAARAKRPSKDSKDEEDATWGRPGAGGYRNLGDATHNSWTTVGVLTLRMAEDTRHHSAYWVNSWMSCVKSRMVSGAPWWERK